MTRLEIADIFPLEKPWYIADVRIEQKDMAIIIYVDYDRFYNWVDKNGQECRIHAHEERTWRHLDIMEYSTRIVCRVPRLLRLDGGTQMAEVPWANSTMRITKALEKRVAMTLRETITISGCCELLKLSWSTVHSVMKRAVDKLHGAALKNTPVVHIGLDEKSFQSGKDYITLMYSHEKRCVVDVVRGRKQEDAVKLLNILEERKKEVKAVSMDMSKAYEAAAKEAIPDALRVFDKFHVSQLINKAVDGVRRDEHAELVKRGCSILTGQKYLFLKDPKNMSETRSEELNTLLNMNLKVSRAYMRKFDFEWFWKLGSKEEASEFFAKWYAKTIRSRLEPMKKLAKSLKAHLNGLLAYHTFSITNAVAEGLNSKIQLLKSAARGLRTFEAYRARILFFCGKLPLEGWLHGN